MAYSQTSDQIIKATLIFLRVATPFDALTTEEIEDIRSDLNDIMLQDQEDGIFVNKLTNNVFSFTSSSEVIGTDGLNYRCILNHTSASNNKPITGTYWQQYWKQENTSGIAWVTATPYTTIGQFTIPAGTLDIFSAHYRYQNNDTFVKILNRPQYEGLPSKYDLDLIVNKLYFERDPSGNVFLTPHPNNTDGILLYTTLTGITESSTSGDSVDTQSRYYSYLKYALAARVGSKYSQVSTGLLAYYEAQSQKFRNQLIRIATKQYGRTQLEAE